MEEKRERFLISILVLIFSMMIVYFSPRYDLISLFLFSLLSVSLFFILSFRDQRKNRRIEDELDRLLGVLQEVDEEDMPLGLENRRFSFLEDNIRKSLGEKKILAQDSLESKRMLLTYMEDVTHQIKTPLTGVLLLLDLMEEEENKEQYIAIIRKDIYRLHDLADVLLRMSSLDAGILPMEKKSFWTKDLVYHAQMGLESFFKREEIKIREIGEDMSIVGDRSWTLEALINLMKNAIEASPVKGIEIELEGNKIYQSILIRDFGPGIERRDLEKLYQRFYKANKKSKGFGIGLPMAKAIMEKQGGELLYYKEDKGNYFEMRFYK